MYDKEIYILTGRYALNFTFHCVVVFIRKSLETLLIYRYVDVYIYIYIQKSIKERLQFSWFPVVTCYGIKRYHYNGDLYLKTKRQHL